MNDQTTENQAYGIRVDQFRTAHSEPAGIIVLELGQDQGPSVQFSMTSSMAQQLVKSLQEQIAKTQSRLN